MATKRVYARRRKDVDDDDFQLPYSCFWKQQTGMEAAATLWNWVERQATHRATSNLKDLIHEAIYRDRPLTGLASYPYQDLRSMKSSPAHLNITMSMVDTATARLTKRRPMPVVSADDAGWTEKLFAKRTSRVIRRKMGSGPVEKMSPNILRDMTIRGDGVGKICRYNGDAHVKRIPIYELVWDELEAQHVTDGNVRTLAHVRPEPRELVMAQYPKYAEQIAAAPRFQRTSPWMMHAYTSDSIADLIEVAEGWHLPSSYDADADSDDGQHIVCIRGGTILREPWRRQRFPVGRVHWCAPTRGYRGTGLVEQLAGIQAKVNDVVRDIQENLYYGSALKVFTPRSSNVNKHHLRARHPVVIEYDGAPPQFVAPQPVSQQAMQFLQYLIQQAYEISGISQMSASSKNVLGANASGKAIDTLDDIQSDRFAHVEAGYIQFRVELAQLLIDEARAMYDEVFGEVENPFDEAPEQLSKDSLAPWIAEHEWDKVEIDSGMYHLTIEPINFLPDSRAGKLSFVSEMSKAGLIPDPTLTADLFDEPDIARMNRYVLGPKHNLDRIMEGLADPDVEMIDLMPDMYANLELGLLMAKGELNDAQANDAPDEVLERYRTWIEQVRRLVKIRDAGAAAPSLPGMQAANMGAAPNAATLQPGLAGAPAAPGMPPMGEPGMGVPPGAAA